MHLLTAEGRTFVEEGHTWHLERINRLIAAVPDWRHGTAPYSARLAEPESPATATEHGRR